MSKQYGFKDWLFIFTGFLVIAAYGYEDFTLWILELIR